MTVEVSDEMRGNLKMTECPFCGREFGRYEKPPAHLRTCENAPRPQTDSEP